MLYPQQMLPVSDVLVLTRFIFIPDESYTCGVLVLVSVDTIHC